ncbi:MAG: RAMP superfamily CRISPR-associated protein [Acidocella sp.]|nr:RAMP superfamily CRISPR-associated protein [Acidocella sp.]
MNRTLHRLKGWALTPVHVGDGTTWTPEGFKLVGGVLNRFEPSAVIAGMTEAVRGQYVKMLRQNGLKQAQDFMRKTAQDMDIREKIGVSASSRNDVETLMKGELKRKGEIHPFVRSGDTPILPGSSLKGALRTAWLAKQVDESAKRDIKTKTREGKVGKTSQVSDEMQSRAFEFAKGKTEQDPMRDVGVGDMQISTAGTLIDKAQILNLKDDAVAAGGTKDMQIHCERLAAIADRGAFVAQPLLVEIATLEPPAAKERRDLADTAKRDAGEAQAIPKTSPDFISLRQACNAHHVNLWFGERNHFYKNTGTDVLMDDLLTAFSLPLEVEALKSGLDKRCAWLLRVGRFSHFESKSIEGIRAGEKRAKNGKNGQRRDAEHMEWGGSRTAACGNNNEHLPFGWIILFDADAAPQMPKLGNKSGGMLQTSNRSAAVAAPDLRPATAAPNAGYRFLKGEKVTNDDETGTVVKSVANSDTKMEVNFDGEIESVSVEGYRKVNGL